jgi:type III restriction enzyme
VAHDTFQAIVEAARRLNAPIHFQHVALTENELQMRTVTVVAIPRNVSAFGSAPTEAAHYAHGGFQDAQESLIAIPQIVMKPAHAAKWSFRSFALDLSAFRYDREKQTLRASYLRSGEIDRIDIERQEPQRGSAEDMIVTRLVAFDDVAYQNCADLLYDLAKQVTGHLSADHSCAQIKTLVALHQMEIAREIHAQMLRHVSRERSVAPEPVIVREVTPLRPLVYTAPAGTASRDFRLPPPDAAHIASDLFGGFTSCLYDVQKFHSDGERRLAVILEREGVPWFRPARRQFDLAYMLDGLEYDYVPDFVVDADDQFLMIEVKAANELANADVVAKAVVGVAWCRAASKDAATRGGKGWAYTLIPHDAIAENMTLAGLVGAYRRS